MKTLFKSMGILIFGLTFILAMAALQVQAQPITANEVMERVENTPVPTDQQLEMTMTLINRRGDKLERVLDVKKQGEDKSYLLFLSPSDVKNTAFLNLSHDNRDDEMYLYLPALRKVRRIASSSKHKNFMGSDFTYADMGDRDINDYTYEMIDREARIDGENLYRIEGTAKHPRDVGYSKLKFWIRKDIFLPVKIEYYDLSGDMLKVQTNEQFKQIEQYWLATHIEMNNVQTNHRTILGMEDIEVDVDLPDMTWTERNLRR
ncbi:MAG: outer membrane lipoprotein-sorting protein [Candidatus Marinimicrobia bacterium]|nr:outer membrane lipoprotein-sorting protein [Candidatus Neomarinimicrobiota bacterium]MCF7829291.1 outer membrane lipoprotein-sorting protein [Candidatus Neomarinimicrobiota bacterium]MCF7880047.1 outer membrane lipoprotein-sorting protein [Candidatus Neomarinimicrobiota bacterium]